MELQPGSYFFAGLSEVSFTKEGIRQICFGKPQFSLQFFNRITSISAKTICGNLAVSFPPPQFAISNDFPTYSHFNWATQKISEYYGGKQNDNSLDMIIYELYTSHNKQYTAIYDILTSVTTKLDIKSKNLIYLYQNNRNLFISLIPVLTKAIAKYKNEEFYDLIPKTDLNIFLLLDKKRFENIFQTTIPEIIMTQTNLIVQSIIETKNDSYVNEIQSLLLSNDTDSVPKTLHMSIVGLKHFDDYVIKPILKLIHQLEFAAAQKFSGSHLQYLVMAYVLKFERICENKQFLENSIEIVRKIESIPPSFKHFLKYVQNDLKIMNTLNVLIGRKLSFEDLEYHSIPYLCRPILDGIDIDSFMFMYNFESYTNGYADLDFTFLVSFYLVINLLTYFNEQKVTQLISYYKDPISRSTIFTELFSILFLTDSSGNFIVPFEVSLKLLQIMSNYKTYDIIDEYISQALAKFKCYDKNNLSYNDLLCPTESLVHPLLIQKKWDLALETVKLSPKLQKFVDLFKGTIENDSAQQKLPNFRYAENLTQYFIETALSTNNLELIERSLKSKPNISDYLQNRYKLIIQHPDHILSPILPTDQYVTLSRSFDALLTTPNSIFSKIENFGNFQTVNNLIDFINICVECGIVTPKDLRNMRPMEKLDEIISAGKFDLALEFAGVNRIDFFQYLFVKYRANENILKLISPIYPMPSLTMALSSLSSSELVKFKSIVLPKNSSKYIEKYYNRKVNPPIDPIISENKEQKRAKIIKLIENDDKSLDDYLYSVDPQLISEIILEKAKNMEMMKLQKYLDFLDCFVPNQKLNHMKEMVTLFLSLKNPPSTLNEAIQQIDECLSQLIRKNKYRIAKNFAELTNKGDLFAKNMIDHVINILLQKHESERALIYCKGFEGRILAQIGPKEYEKRFELMNMSSELRSSNSEEFRALSVYFSVPPRLRSKQPDISQMIDNICINGGMDVLFEMIVSFKLDISKISSMANKETVNLVSSYGYSLSIPILVFLIDDINKIISKYHKFIEKYTQVADVFVPIAMHISAFVVVDCLEHEAYCERFCIIFVAFLRKLQRVSSMKKEIENLIERTQKVQSLASISFYARHHFIYGIDIVEIDSKCDHIHDILISNDYSKLANNFKHTSENSAFFFTMLKFTDFERASVEFEKFKDHIKNYDEFINRLLWALRSPLCLDEDYVRSPIVDIPPQDMYHSVKEFILTKTTAFCPSWPSVATHYIQELKGIEYVIKFYSELGLYGRSIKELKNRNFDNKIFVKSVLEPSLSYGKVNDMLEYFKAADPYFEQSADAMDAAVQFVTQHGLDSLRYEMDLMIEDFSDAVLAIQNVYAKEKKPENRAKILEKCENDLPHELLNYNYIELQKEFVKIQKDNGIPYNVNVHLFGEGLINAMEILFNKKLFQFACKVAVELKINPSPIINRIAKAMNQSRARKFVSNLAKFMQNSHIFEDWVTVLLHYFNNNPKTKSYVLYIIEKEITSARFKCHLLIQCGYINEARKIAEAENLAEFIILLSD